MSDLERSELIQADADHLIHPNHPIGEPVEFVITRGEGIRLFDADGRAFIDGRSQLNCANLGYGYGRLVTAMQAQLDELQYLAIFYQFTHPQAVRAATRIAQLAPGDLNHVMFTSGGSEANETAMSLVRLFWARRGDAERQKILTRYSAYHGGTLSAMSATGMEMAGRPGIQRLVPGFIHAPAINYSRYRTSLTPEQYCDLAIDQLREIIEAEGPGTIAAFIGEPVVGVGGYLPPPPGYWPRVRELCDEYGILMIVDEVMTGFHRTGAPLAVNHWDVTPDLLVLGKGINASYAPCGATVLSDEIFEAIRGVKVSGFTHSAHPVAMAAVNATLDAFELDGIPGNVALTSRSMRERLEREFLPLPHVGATEGLGLMLAIELVTDKVTNRPIPNEILQHQIVDRALERGLIIRGRSGRVALCPPLIATVDEGDEILDILFDLIAGLEVPS